MADRHYRHAKLINGCFHVDRLTVDNIVFSPVDDDTFNIRQSFQFCCCDIMGFDLAVNTQFPYGASTIVFSWLPKSKITIISCCISILLSAIKFYTSLDILIVTYLTPASPLNYCRKLN